MSRAQDILEAASDLQYLSEGIPWGKGARGVLSHLETEMGDDTKKKISLLNRSRSKLKDLKKVKTLDQVISMLQRDESGKKSGAKEKEPGHVEKFAAEVHAAIGGETEEKKPGKGETDKDSHKDLKAKIDAALGSKEPQKGKKPEKDEKPEKEGGEDHKELKAKIDAALGPDEPKGKQLEKKGKQKDDHGNLKDKIDAALGSDGTSEKEEPKKGKEDHKEIKAKIDAALGSDEPPKETPEKGGAEDHAAIKAKVDAALGDAEVEDPDIDQTGLAGDIDKALGSQESGSGDAEPPANLQAEIDTALGSSPPTDSVTPEKQLPPEHPVVGGETLGGGPGIGEAASIYAKKESENPEASKVLKRVSSFSQSYPSSSKVLSSGLGGVNPAIAHYQSAKSYKENPTSATGMVSKHPAMTSALIGGPTGVAAGASYLARKEEGKPRAEVWENIADFAGKHKKTAEALGGGGVNPALAYYYASKQKKPKKSKPAEENASTSVAGGEV